MPFSYYPSPFNSQPSRLSAESSTNKRKHESSDEEDEESGNDSELRESQTPDLRASAELAWVSLPADLSREYEAAGQPFNQELPSAPFPHRAANFHPTTRAPLTPSQLQLELAHLNPPLLGIDKENQLLQRSRSSGKQSNLARLITLMHHCLMCGDYIRAGHAFEILLRMESGGQHVDLRGQNLWGIGVEVLLHSKAQGRRGFDGLAQDTSHRVGTLHTSLEDFELVKRYFERLVLEYPYQGWQTNTLSALHFYPLMFSHWIAFIEEKDKLARAPFKHQSEDNVSEDSSDAESEFLTHRGDELDSIRHATLGKAKEVAKRMDEVMQSFPHSEDVTMWQLRGNLHLWIADLLQPSDSQGRNNTGPLFERPTPSERLESGPPEPEANVSQRHQDIESNEREEQVQHAAFAFEKAKICVSGQ